MENILTYSPAQIKNYDPTHTTALRNAFASKIKQSFEELVKVVKISVDTNDCFGLRKPNLSVFQMTPIQRQAFEFSRNPEKIEAFINWLQEQIDRGILQLGYAQQTGSSIESLWMNMYILDAYKRGLMRARSELIQAGFAIPSITDTGGILASMNLPFHMDRVGVLYTRTFTDLKGITAAMDSQISRILAEGMINGDGPALLARKIVAVINGTGVDKLGITDTLGRFIPGERRATMLARTEIIRAHHLAMIQEYRNWGLEGVKVKGEWNTAGDDRVCEKCASMDGKVFTLDEIEWMIPAHVCCRCLALPWIEDIRKYLN